MGAVMLGRASSQARATRAGVEPCFFATSSIERLKIAGCAALIRGSGLPHNALNF